MSADAPPVAGPDRALLRLPEHDRVPRRIVPVAAGPLRSRSDLHPAALPRRVDVPDPMDRDALDAAESADADDDVDDAGDDGLHLLPLPGGRESVLRGHQRRDDSAADLD